MRYLHTMIRVVDLERALRFYREGLGFTTTKRNEYPKERFTLVFMKPASAGPEEPEIELTHNWDTSAYERGTAFGHLAYEVPSIDAVRERLRQHGYDLSWGPDLSPSGRMRMAFVDDPDGYEIELLERIA